MSGFDYMDYGAMDEATAVGMALFYLIYFLVMGGISIAAYVFQSVSMYSIANRRGIKNPWLSWVPLGNLWMLGCISDQYRYVAKGQVKNKRKSLLILGIVMSLLAIVVLAVEAMLAIGLMDMNYLSDSESAAMVVGLIILAVVTLALIALCIAVTVIQYMALYDLFVSCDPNNGVLFLVLSILISMAMPICMFICRKKDGGMPPRKAAAPVFVPQPAYQPAQPPVVAVPVEETPVEETPAEETPVEEAPVEEAPEQTPEAE